MIKSNTKNRDLRQILSSIGPSSCPSKFNFHCHTTCSDGSLSPIDLIKQATEKGIHHISVTDHHTCDAYKQIQPWIDNRIIKKLYVPNLWVGIEISCVLSKCLVHILGFDFDLNSKSLTPYMNKNSVVGELLKAENVIKAIHSAGGIAILAHPARYRMSFDILIDAAKKINIDGAECWYDYEYSVNWRPTPFICERIYWKLKNLDLLSTCGTDTHGRNIDCR